MPNALVTVDCGNSTIDCLRHDDGMRLVMPSASLGARAAEALVEFFRGHLCLAASVVLGSFEPVDRAASAAGSDLLWLRRPSIRLLPVSYNPIASLGIDRWLAAYGAYCAHGACVVVDCGSATTVNQVRSDGIFAGGLIGPGLAAMVSGMRTATPALPSLAVTDVFLKDPEAPAESTQSGLEAGLIVAYRGSVDAMVDSYAEAIEMGARLVLTGGGAAFVSSGLLRSHVMARDLKHMAMAMVLGNDRTAYT